MIYTLDNNVAREVQKIYTLGEIPPEIEYETYKWLMATDNTVIYVPYNMYRDTIEVSYIFTGIDAAITKVFFYNDRISDTRNIMVGCFLAGDKKHSVKFEVRYASGGNPSTTPAVYETTPIDVLRTLKIYRASDNSYKCQYNGLECGKTNDIRGGDLAMDSQVNTYINLMVAIGKVKISHIKIGDYDLSPCKITRDFPPEYCADGEIHLAGECGLISQGNIFFPNMGGDAYSCSN